MEVSIVIPFFGSVEWLYDAVNSINEPSSLEYEVIIIDDGSEEDIDFNRFEENRGRITYFRQPNQGPGKARNIGISKAKGEYIAFLDADDLFVKNKLTNQLTFMKSNGFVWTHTSYTRFFPSGKENIVHLGYFHGYVFPICLAHNPIATPTVMVKKNVLDEFPSPFSEDMRFGQDGYFWLRLATKYPLGVIDTPLTRVRIGRTNSSRRAYNHLYMKAYLYEVMSSNSNLIQDQNVPKLLSLLHSKSAQCFHFVDQRLTRYFGKTGIELISKIIYFPIYVSFKLYYFLHK